MEAGEPGGAFCLFSCGERMLAVRVEAVEGFLEDARLVRLPLAPRPLAGLCAHRGGLLPVIRPSEIGERGDEGPGVRRSAVLNLRTGRGPLGLLVGRGGIAIVEEGRAVAAGEVAALPAGLIATGSIEHEGRSYPLLDPERTWAAVRDLISRGYEARRRAVIPEPSEEVGAS